jgi:hypothetical protein
MNVYGKQYRTIWQNDAMVVQIIDQRHLPHKFIIEELTNQGYARARGGVDWRDSWLWNVYCCSARAEAFGRGF